MENLAQELKKLRNHLNLSQLEMAKKFGVTMQSYRMWESGAHGANAERLEKIKQLIKETYGTK